MMILALALVSSQAEAVERDSDGRIKRSAKAVSEFRKDNPCPATGQVKGKCPGYVIDHVYPLACGGLDDPLLMHWQSVKDAKLKDRWERRGCHKDRPAEGAEERLTPSGVPVDEAGAAGR